MKRLIFGLTSLLLLPVTVLGEIAFNLYAGIKSRRQGTSLTAYSPLFSRYSLHQLGTRRDPVCAALTENLPTTWAPALRAQLEPTLFAIRLSTYTPRLFRIPSDQEITVFTFGTGRIRFYDELVTDGVAAGASQVVFLGAGYDTRSYGVINTAGARLFEVDQPKIQRIKRAALNRAGVDSSKVTFVEADFTNPVSVTGLFGPGRAIFSGSTL